MNSPEKEKRVQEIFESFFAESDHFKSLRPQSKVEWSDEDKRILKGIIGLVDHNQHYNVSNKEMLAWLKSLRPQPKQEWSEEDEENMQAIVDTIKRHWLTLPGNTLIDWFKSLRNRVGKEFLQPHWKLSEDEERLIKTSISFLKDFADKGYENAVECIDWLKSKLNGNSGK